MSGVGARVARSPLANIVLRCAVAAALEQRASDDEGGDERSDPHAASPTKRPEIVGSGLEHDESGQQDRGDRQRRGEQAEPDELQPQGGQPPQRERDHEPGRERRERDHERIEDHGANL